MQNKAFVLASRPTGAITPANFKLVSRTLPAPNEGEISVRHHFLSLDPYMRGRMNDSKSYAASQQIDEVMIGGTVGIVTASRHDGFKEGDAVVGMGGWQLANTAKPQGLYQKIDTRFIPEQAYLGPVGMPGVTAWAGMNNIIDIKAGETLVVSAATGAVGTVVGQLGKLKGAYVVGIAGGKEKCDFAVKELGFDACVDHKSPTFKEDLKAATPKGIDGVFENVGGLPLQLCFKRMNAHGRIAVCGLVASSYDGTPTPMPDISNILTMRVKMQGFIVSDDMRYWPQALKELGEMVATGKLKYRETIAQGLESAPDAFIGMLSGKNFGKQLVKLK